VLGAIALPLAVLMKIAFARQAGLSKNATVLRNQFSSDITDRYNGLLQVHVDGNDDYHVTQGIRSQPELTSVELRIGLYQALIGSFGLLLPFTALLGFSAWIGMFGSASVPSSATIAAVGILGVKVAGQLNGLVASIGNMSRLSGSLHPVLSALGLPLKRATVPTESRTTGINIKEVAFSYGNKEVLNDVSLQLRKGVPFVLTGRSGKGKTTLANLIAGLYVPTRGSIDYESASGALSNSRKFSAHIGFVTQDIYLFQGSLRSNLTSGRNCSEKHIWEVLEQVDAAEFVRELGGLDVQSTEAGRALSGGQRRRLGVARVLLSGADVLIFDEITAGLDAMNRTAILKMVECLSREYVVVMISHEEVTIPGTVTHAL
jgi:ABC-type transport system involved in cytochrome bd biosynthesis fused ATPase/permease subunit